ncbi:putative ABC transporter permease [Erysipelothrix urinaevulpis]|uniref:putative ABC transporter permease n=1 Tax=Erysipelothrix urinaevulpis TaxID=2683717 RepID=UPI00135797A9|nr:putative ABC transporter permease [Erysipelothrix urinaevulpis]
MLFNYIYWLIYAFFGYIIETLYVSIPNKKFVQRGFLHGPVIPIYAFGAMAILYFLEPFFEYPSLVFILGIFVTSGLEYITSFAMEKIFDMRWWDYSKRKFNIKGRICLRNSLLFGLLSVILVEWIHPIVKDIVKIVPVNTLQLIASISFVILMIDFISSVLVAVNIKRYIEDLEVVKEEILTKLSTDNISISIEEFLDAGQELLNEFDDHIKQIQVRLKQSHARFRKREHNLLKRFPTVKSRKFSKTLEELKNKLKQ